MPAIGNVQAKSIVLLGFYFDALVQIKLTGTNMHTKKLPLPQ